jgi:hypothetical protein
MTPLLLRPFLLKTTTETMINPQQNSPQQMIKTEVSHGTPSTDTKTAIKSDENFPVSTEKRSTRDYEDEKHSLICSTVPKIILHRTHPPSFSMYKGSRLYHRNKQHRVELSQLQTPSAIKPITNEGHCKCCTKKANMLHKSFLFQIYE